MEISGVVLRRVPCLSRGFPSSRRSASNSSDNFSTVGFQPMKTRGIMCNAYVDQGHLSYYFEPTSCGFKKEKITAMEKKKTTTKKRMKLLKGLTKDLTMLLSMRYGPNSESAVIGGISEATEVLLKQLEQLKAEKKRLKKQRKEEKAKAKAMKAMKTVMESESSSSSSSESSDSDCGEEVIDMNRSRNNTQPFVQSLPPGMQQTVSAVAVLPCTENVEAMRDCLISKNLKEDDCSRVVGNDEALQPTALGRPCMASPGAIKQTLRKEASCRTSEKEVAMGMAEPCLRRIEVCMGGKCKKSGGAELMREFEKGMMGVEGSVVACKCMGKCRDGPNIRIVNKSDGVVDDSMRTPSNSVCLGVGLQDVEAIVSSFFGQGSSIMGLGFVSV